jgi:acetylornithine deacetylase/succinyl-diaminopimelate desuccinylase-like protein
VPPWQKKRLYSGKTIYVTGSVCEEYCDGENLKHFYKEFNVKPDYCIICEPCDNTITLGHKGKAQVRIITHGVSAMVPRLKKESTPYTKWPTSSAASMH